MSQEKIYELLKHETEWLSSEEIHEKLNKSIALTNIRINLRKLVIHNAIMRERSEDMTYGYRYKIRK